VFLENLSTLPAKTWKLLNENLLSQNPVLLMLIKYEYCQSPFTSSGIVVVIERTVVYSAVDNVIINEWLRG